MERGAGQRGTMVRPPILHRQHGAARQAQQVRAIAIGTHLITTLHGLQPVAESVCRHARGRVFCCMHAPNVAFVWIHRRESVALVYMPPPRFASIHPLDARNPPHPAPLKTGQWRLNGHRSPYTRFCLPVYDRTNQPLKTSVRASDGFDCSAISRFRYHHRRRRQ